MVIWPSVIAIEMPRPATMRISVAMIGWIPRTETSKPFQAPSTMQTTTAYVIAITAVLSAASSPAPMMRVQATAPAMAAIAPTERSMPRVAMTSVMPSATSITGALLRRMSMTLP